MHSYAPAKDVKIQQHHEQRIFVLTEEKISAARTDTLCPRACGSAKDFAKGAGFGFRACFRWMRLQRAAALGGSVRKLPRRLQRGSEGR